MRGRLVKAKEGFFVGHVSYGYRVQLASNGKNKLIVRHPIESEIVKSIFEKVAYEGYTTTSLTKWLNSVVSNHSTAMT